LNLDLYNLLSEVQALDKKIISNTPATVLLSANMHDRQMVNNLSPSWMFVYLESADVVRRGDSRFQIDGAHYSGTVMELCGQPFGAVIRLNQYAKGLLRPELKPYPGIISLLSGHSDSSKLILQQGREKKKKGCIPGKRDYPFSEVKLVDYNENRPASKA
jgi:hypothetical protein